MKLIAVQERPQHRYSWHRDAVDREKSGQIEELSRKLQHVQGTSEQYRSQAESASKRLTQAEEAKKARETDLASLRLEVQAQSDSRCPSA